MAHGIDITTLDSRYGELVETNTGWIIIAENGYRYPVFPPDDVRSNLTKT